jgi:hypothetical protein
MSERRATIERHLDELASRQYPDGRIPIMFVDDPLRWIALKTLNSIRNFRVSFLLKQYLSKDGIGQLSPWTRDSEFLYALAVAEFVFRTRDIPFLNRHMPHVERALGYVEAHLMRDGLVIGGDWRDTRPDFADKALLSNNCLLYRAYQRLGMKDKAEEIKRRINNCFPVYHLLTNGQNQCHHYRDYIGTDEFDTLGNALVILFGIAPSGYWDRIIIAAEAYDTPFGYKVNGVTLPPKSEVEERVMLATNQHGVIWPFIHGFMILAALAAGRESLAARQFEKWTKLDGFYEFYDPRTGVGLGSSDQVWSAALYFRCALALTIPELRGLLPVAVVGSKK